VEGGGGRGGLAFLRPVAAASGSVATTRPPAPLHDSRNFIRGYIYDEKPVDGDR